MNARAFRSGRARYLGVAVGVLALVGSLVGCSGSPATQGGSGSSSPSGASSSTGASSPTKTLRYGVASSIVSTGVSDPSKQQATDGGLLSIAYAPLFHAEASGKIVPALAAKWQYVGSGHKVFDFTLRTDARFSDGTPVTAAAVVGWLNYYHKSKNIFSTMLGSDPQFKAVSKWKVEITLKTPLPDLAFLFSDANANWGFVASPKAVANPKLMTSKTYGAGPYMLDSAKSAPGDHYTYVPNPYYYNRSAIKWKQIYVKAFQNSSTALQALESGQIDVDGAADATSADTATSAGLQIVSAPFSVLYLTLHVTSQKALANVNVRRAMNYALDRKAIANTLFGKYGQGSSQFTIPPDADPGLENYYSYDPDKAKSLLAAAGFSNGFSFQIDSGQGIDETAAQLVAHYLEAVGIKTKIKTYTTSAAYVKAALSPKSDSAILGADVGTPTPIEYPSFLEPGSQLAVGYPDNPTVDQLYQQGLQASNPAQYWKPMWAITVKDAWFLPLAASSNMVFVSKSVGGVQMSKGRPWALPIEWFPK